PLHHYLTTRVLSPPRSTVFPYTTLFRSLVAEFPRQPHDQDPGRPCGRRPPPVPGPRRGAVVLAAGGGERQGGARGSSGRPDEPRDRKSTRLNSSHVKISYAVFCLKKKNK